MMRKVGFLLLVVMLLAFVPPQAFAADPRAGGTVVIGSKETVNDDLYAFGGTINVLGTVNGDVVTSGGTITISGVVTGDLTTAGGTITVSGEVRGSIRAAGGIVTINGPVGEDVVAAGGVLSLGPSARVGRDLLIGAGSATVAGPVGRHVRASSDELTLSGPVGGDVHAKVAKALHLADGAVVNGNLFYTSPKAVEIHQGATVRGKVERSEPQMDRRVERVAPGPLARASNAALGWLRTLVGLLALGLLLVLPFSGFSRRILGTLGSSPWASFGLGIVLLMVVPIATLILFILGLAVGGWWLAPLALAVYGIAIALGYVVAGLFVGYWIMNWVGRPGIHLAWALLLGLAILTLLSWLPVTGALSIILAVLLGVGALALASVRAYRTPSLSIAE